MAPSKIGPAFRIIRFETLPSTNSWMREHLGELDNLSVVTTPCQTQGRGQRGNRWLSAPGENLTFSVLLRPESLPATQQMRLTALSTVALREVLMEEGFPVKIKWPNDLYFGERKLAGMLIENILQGSEIAASIIGIGLNVNQVDFDPAIPNPTSLKRISGRGDYDPDALLERFLEHLSAWLPRLGSDDLWQAYTSDLFGLGQRRQWSDAATGASFYGTINSVLPDGRLELLLPDGSPRLFAFKEVGYII